MSGSTSYRVSARLQIEGDAARTLALVARALTSLDQGIVRTERSLRALLRSMNSLGAGAADVRRAAAAMDQLRGGTQAAGQALRGATQSLSAQARALDRVSQSAQAATASMRALSAAAPGRISVHGGAGGGQMGRIGELAGVGMAAHSGARAVGAIMTNAGSLQQAETMIAARGFSAEDRARIRAALPGIIRAVPGISYTEAALAIGEQIQTLGSVDQAIATTPALLRASRLSAIQTNRPTMDAAQPLSRFMGIHGSWTNAAGDLDIERGERVLLGMQQAMIAFGERFNPREMQMFMQQAGTMGRTVSLDYLFTAVPSLLQETSGQRLGTMHQAWNRQFISGVMPEDRYRRMVDAGLISPRNAQAQAVSPQVLEQLVAQGLIQPGEDLDELRTQSNLVRINPQAISGYNLARQNPFAYMQTYMREAAERAGATTEAERLAFYDRIGSTAVIQRFMQQLEQRREIENDIANFRRVQEQDRGSPGRSTNIVLNEGWTNAVAALTMGFTNMLTAVGNAAAENVVPFMHRFGRALNDLSDWFKDNPGVSTGLVAFVAAVTGLAAVGAVFITGSLALAGIGALTAGLGFLGVSLVAIAPQLFLLTAIGMGLKYIYDAIPGDSFREKIDWVVGGLRSLAEGISGFVDRIKAILDRIAGAWNAGRDGTFPSLPTEEPANQRPGGPQRPFGQRGRMGGFYQDPLPQSFTPNPPSGAEGGASPIILQLDGREVGRGVLPHIGRAASGPIQAPARFDTRRTYSA